MSMLLFFIEFVDAQSILFTADLRKPVAGLSVNSGKVIVTDEEFERAYNRNTGIQGYEQLEVSEFLEMYINFKLKVSEAIRLGYDTTVAFRAELNEYINQLSESYKNDPVIMENMSREYYEGILLFNISNAMVWHKANADSAGLEKFRIEYQDKIMSADQTKSRGALIAAYQDYLDKLWIERLRKGYRVKVNKKVMREISGKYVLIP